MTSTFVTVVGKGDKEREVYVSETALNLLKAYLKTRKDNNPALFLSSRGKRLSTRMIQAILAKYCVWAGVPHQNVHRLRHTFATQNGNAGMSMFALKEIMGHTSLDTTMRYFKLNERRARQEYFAAMQGRKNAGRT